MTTASAVLVLLVLAAPAAPAPVRESAAARAQARQCTARSGEPAVAACRRALELGLPPSRAALVRRLLAGHLIALDRPDEAIEVYRDATRAEPDEADAHWRLGQALLALAGDAAGALPPLDRARELAPEEPRVHATRGEALAFLGRHAEAVAAFEAALKLDPGFLDHRPGARAAYEAARRGERWPPPLGPEPEG
jgi:tetratricopeptide (TPR) repeat protein